MQLIGGFFFMRHGFKMSMWRPGQLLEIHDFYGGLSIGMVHRRFDKSCVFSSTPCLTAEGQAIITHHKSINHQQSMNHPLIQCIIVYLCFEVKTSNRFWMCSRRVLQKFSFAHHPLRFSDLNHLSSVQHTKYSSFLCMI